MENKTIIDKIKSMLFNIDMALVEAQSEREYLNAKINRYKNSRNTERRKKFLISNIELEKNDIYIQELVNAKKNVYDNINAILDKYQPKYKQIFNLYFLDNKDIEYISNETNYSIDMVNMIIERLNSELINL